MLGYCLGSSDTGDVLGVQGGGEIQWYVRLLEGIAHRKGRALGELVPDKVKLRFCERDAALFRRGCQLGLLSVDESDYLRTRDPYQATAWLVEGNPPWPCWEYLPHGAAYVELLLEHRYPYQLVRFETPEAEAGLDADLAVLAPNGDVLVLGEVKKEARELNLLEEQLLEFSEHDPGPPSTGSRRRASQKLAHRLWLTQAPWLWLVAPDDRRTYRVGYSPLRLELTEHLPTPETLGIHDYISQQVPRIRIPAGDDD